MPLQRQGSSLMSHLRAGPPPRARLPPGNRHTAADPASPLKLAAAPPPDAEQSLPVASSPSRTDLKIAQLGGSRHGYLSGCRWRCVIGGLALLPWIDHVDPGLLEVFGVACGQGRATGPADGGYLAGEGVHGGAEAGALGGD